MTNVGNLNATLTLSAFEFNSGLKQSETAALQFATTTEVASRRADAAMAKVGRTTATGFAGRFASPIQQFGFGIQDFASQLETRGLGGAIGAVTNNVQMMGAAFGPAGMAVTALGGALAGILLPRLIESGSIFGKTAQEAEAFAAKVRKSSEEAFAPWRERENLKFDVMQGTEKQLDMRLERMRHQYKMLADEREAEAKASWNAFNLGLMDEVDVRNKRWHELDKQMKDLNRSGQELEGLRPQIQEREENEKTQDERAERFGQQLRAEDDLRRKQLEDYGTEAQRAEAKISAERQRLKELEISKEGMQRFEAQSAVEMKRAEIADAEKALAAMGPAAGSSAGVTRDSAEGIRAINRAAAGSRSEQSVEKESLKVQKDSLKKLEEIARNGGGKPPARFQLSG